MHWLYKRAQLDAALLAATGPGRGALARMVAAAAARPASAPIAGPSPAGSAMPSSRNV